MKSKNDKKLSAGRLSALALCPPESFLSFFVSKLFFHWIDGKEIAITPTTH